MVVLVAFVGAVVGGLLNVVIDRVSVGQAPLRRDAPCPSGGRVSRATNLARGACYVACRGRRRPWRVLAVEVATAGLFALLWALDVETNGGSPASPGDALWPAASAAYGCTMIVLFVIDLELRRVPNVIVLPAIALALAMAPVLAWLAPRYAHHGLVGFLAPALPVEAAALIGQVAGGVAAFAILWVIWRIAPQGMGAGDVKLAGFAGLVAGFPGALAAVFGSFILGGMVGAALLVTGRAGRKTAIPFAPFLIVTTFAMMLRGDALLVWYLAR